MFKLFSGKIITLLKTTPPWFRNLKLLGSVSTFLQLSFVYSSDSLYMFILAAKNSTMEYSTNEANTNKKHPMRYLSIVLT